MTGLDTNILVRFFTKDDVEQSGRAVKFMRTLTTESPGYVSLVSLIEFVWVLRSKYRLSKAELIQRLEQLLDSPELIVENHSAVTHALRRFTQLKADFADCLIERSCHVAGCRETVTFDVDASRFAGMTLL
ncbi:MAG TPA: type II toxin-antitoxin system VapC family toxin [Terracidiphilus sp.]|nr:type II toxin-antitoxin system VapC family toxin [Terracidiphilus sp.]